MNSCMKAIIAEYLQSSLQSNAILYEAPSCAMHSHNTPTAMLWENCLVIAFFRFWSNSNPKTLTCYKSADTVTQQFYNFFLNGLFKITIFRYLAKIQL